MKAKRQRHQSAFKAKVGLEALLGIKTVAEIAREYQVHPTQVSQWKRAIVERLPEVFEHGATAQAEASEREVARLEQKVGQLTMELDWLKKKVQTTGSLSGQRLELVSPAAGLSLRRQCELLGVSRSGYYYEPCPESPENLRLMRRLDELHLAHPVYGRPRLTVTLQREGWRANEKRIGRLMRVMDLEAIYCKPGTSTPQPGHEIYPYLLRHKAITGPDQVWCADITYIPMKHGFMHLMAVMDWWSRFVLAWELSNTLDAAFCVQAWQLALARGNQPPLIANTDQGAQFTAADYVGAVQAAGVPVSMDGRGRWMDNRFVERLWRSLKYEDIYLRGYEHGRELRQGVGNWFGDYNGYRPHQALDHATPAEVYRAPESHGAKPASWA